MPIPLELKIVQLADHPDYSFLPDQDFDWTYSAYGDVHEVIPDDMPEPLGKAVVTTTTMDANLNHCLATGKSLAGCLHFVNKTPVDMKFTPSKAGPCIWLRKASNLRCYEYIAIYVDDLCIATESPSTIIDIFKIKYNLKVKGDGKLSYHLGTNSMLLSHLVLHNQDIDNIINFLKMYV